MKTLYISDLDGTLLNDSAKLHPYSVQTLNSLIECGLNFTYATARSWVSAYPITKDLKLQLPVITYNGAFIVNPSSGEIIRAFTIKNGKLGFALSAMQNLNLYPLVYTLIDGAERVMWVEGHETSGICSYVESRKNDRRLMGVRSWKELNQGQVFYITVIGTQSELAPLAAIIENEPGYASVFGKDFYSGDYWLEIYDEQASKAAGLEWLRDNYGFDNVICFGDNLNDIPMFQAADEAYAVQNACDELKLAASGVTGSNEENAVVRFIEEHCCIFLNF